MDIVVQLVIAAVFGTIVSILASQRGRSGVGWFFVGFFGGCLGLILVLVLPDLKVQQERERRLAAENRRLREQVRKDRMVADSRHEEVAKRLQVHDKALGVDTGARRELPSAPPAPAVVTPAVVMPAGPPLTQRQWWFVRDGARQGPVPFHELQVLWVAGAIDDASLVWSHGMPQWVPVNSIRALREALDA